MANEKRLVAYDPIAFGEFTQSLKNTLEVYDPYSDGYEDGVERIEDWLEFNYVDAVEVVHGRWIVDKEHLKATCSECGKILRFSDEMQIAFLHDEERFCYYCGAKMDAKE